MKTEKEIITRIRQCSSGHLGEYNSYNFLAYYFGYTAALYHNGIEFFDRVVSNETLRGHIKEKYEIREFPNNLRVFSYLRLITNSDKEELDLYFTEAFEAASIRNIRSEAEELKLGGSVEEILQYIGKRPEMYLGNRINSAVLASFLFGYSWAEKDFGFEQSEIFSELTEFQLWFDQKEPIAVGAPWYKTMLVLSIDEVSSFYSFFEVFSDYLQGRDPSFRRKVLIDKIIENMKKNSNKPS